MDIVEISRIRKAHRRLGNRFLKKIFSKEEIKYCIHQKNRYQHLAARLAAKEAVLKAFSEGWQGRWKWTDMVVRRQDSGRPEVILFGEAEKLSKRLGVRRISLSISHSRNYAVAAVLLEKKR